MTPFDGTTAAFAPDHPTGCRLLAEEPLTPLGMISHASNGALLCRLGEAAERRFAVYKPEQFERPLWDFPGCLYQREVAAYEVSEFLGWALVPPTIRRDGPRGPGSVQLFVPHDPQVHYFTLLEEDAEEEALARLALFDLVINNADRKGGHVLRSTTSPPRLYAIDNALTFHTEPKLRTVVWDVDDVPIQDAWRDDLRRLAAALDGDGPLTRRLRPLLTRPELRMLAQRAARAAALAHLPHVHPDERLYPWPPI